MDGGPGGGDAGVVFEGFYELVEDFGEDAAEPVGQVFEDDFDVVGVGAEVPGEGVVGGDTLLARFGEAHDAFVRLPKLFDHLWVGEEDHVTSWSCDFEGLALLSILRWLSA